MRSLVLVWALAAIACRYPTSTRSSAIPPAAPGLPLGSPAPLVPGESLSPKHPAPPPQALPRPLGFPPLEIGTLGNGLTVQVIERRGLPLVRGLLVVAGGSSTDGQKPGVSTLAIRAATAGGAASRSAVQMRTALADIGTRVDVVVAPDHVAWAFSMPSQHFAQALDLVSLPVLEPQFALRAFQDSRQELLADVRSWRTTESPWPTQELLARKLYELPVGRHPYAHRAATSAELRSLQLYDCQTWYERHIVPEGAHLVLVGDVTFAGAKEAATRVFGPWQRKRVPAPAFVRPEAPTGVSSIILDQPSRKQSTVTVGLLIPERESPDYPLIELATEILCASRTGRLALASPSIDALGQVESCGIGQLAHAPNLLAITVTTGLRQVPEVISVLLSQLDAMAQPPSRAELSAAIGQLTTRWHLELEGLEGLAQRVASLSLSGMTPARFEEQQSALAHLVPRDVEEVTRRYFMANHSVVVAAGDAARLEEPLARLGPVRVVDPNLTVIRTRGDAPETGEFKPNRPLGP